MANGDSGCMKMCLIGCVFAIVLAGLATALIVYMVYTQGPQVASLLVEKVTHSVIEESGLPEEERAALKEQVSRMTDKVAAKEIGIAELDRFYYELEGNPLLGVILLQGFRVAYIENGQFVSEEAKPAARLTVERVQRGLMEDQIALDEFNKVLETFNEVPSATDEMPPMDFPAFEEDINQIESPALDRELSPEEVVQFLERLETLADEKNLSTEPYEVRIVDEFRAIVDRVLGETTGPAGVNSATGAIETIPADIPLAATAAVEMVTP